MQQQNNRKARARAFLAAAVSFVSTFSASSALARTDGTWIADVGTTGGNWSNSANWFNGVVPDGGGVATFITPATFTTAPLVVFQDAPTTTVSGITFNTYITVQPRTTTATSTNTLTLTGPATINHTLPSINGVSVQSFGHLFSGPIAGSAGLTKVGPGTVSLWATNTYSGGTTVNGGILVARQHGDLVFGNPSGNVAINDATIRVTSGAWSTARQINLGGTATLDLSSTGSGTFTGAIAGSGNLIKYGGGQLASSVNNTFTGSTNVLAGTLLLNGSGAISSSSGFISRSTVTLDNSGTNLGDRLNDAMPVTLNGNFLNYTGSNSANSSETLGATTFSRGTTQIAITPGTGRDATITAASVARDTGGALFVRGDGLGTGTGGASVILTSPPATVGGAGTVGSTNVSIIPWAYGNAVGSTGTLGVSTSSFLTYGAAGLRPLDVNTEHVSTITAAAATDNVRVTASEVIAAPTTVNSLTIAPNSGNPLTGAATLSGNSGTLTVTSGAILNLVGSGTINNPINFGTAEGIIHSPGGLIIGGAITGSGGLTKQGAGSLTLISSASSYTGTTTIGGGTLAFAANVPASGNGPLGSGTSPVVLAPAGFGTGGSTARMVYNGLGTGTFDRDILVSGRVATNNSAILPGIGAAANNAIVFSGDITLDDSPLALISGSTGGTVRVNGDISGNGAVIDGATNVVLTGNNTFTGGVDMGNTSTWWIGSDSALGSGMIRMVHLSTATAPTIAAFGGPRVIPNETAYVTLQSTTYWVVGGNQDITFTGSINLSGSFTHNIANTALTTYAGTLHTGGFTKSGAGTLVLSGNNIYTGNTTISTGVLRVASPTALGTPQAPSIVATGATLELTNNATTSEPVTINGTGVGANGALRSTSGNNSVASITLASASTVGVDAGKLAAGNVQGSFALTKVGAGQLNVNRLRVGDVNVNAGTIAVNGGLLSSEPTPFAGAAQTSTITALNLPGGATPTASLDLVDNDMISTGSTVASLVAQVAYARDGGAWDRPGLTSSGARASLYHLKTLGVMSGADYNSVGGTGLFDGLSYVAGDSLVKYTGMGDANFDGVVNSADTARTDLGLANGLTGWVNGDYDSSGVVDYWDYAWQDVSYNVEQGTIQRAIDYVSGDDRNSPGLDAPPVATVVNHLNQLGSAYGQAFLSIIPEPASLGGVVLACATMRRRRRS